MVHKKLKMFIVLRHDLSPSAAVVAAAHASLGTYLTFLDNPLMVEWQTTSFIKVICKALNKEHFDALKKLGRHRVFTESTLDNLEVSIGFDIIKPTYSVFEQIPRWVL